MLEGLFPGAFLLLVLGPSKMKPSKFTRKNLPISTHRCLTVLDTRITLAKQENVNRSGDLSELPTGSDFSKFIGDIELNSNNIPLKINMEHNHGGLEDHFPIKMGDL